MVGGRHAQVAFAPVLVYQDIVAADHTYFGMRIEECHLKPQAVGITTVVEVLPGDILTPGLGDTVVSCLGST